MNFKEFTIRGQEFVIEIDHDGNFFCDHLGSRIEALSLNALKDKLAKVTKPSNIAIPFVYWDKDYRNPHIVEGVAVGIHAGNDNLLVKYKDGKVVQMSNWHAPEIVDPKHKEALAKVCKAVDEAQQAKEDFLRTHKMNLRAAVVEATKGETK